MPPLLKRFRQAVLAKAFRGELTERDPNDEPASVLLVPRHAIRLPFKAGLSDEPAWNGAPLKVGGTSTAPSVEPKSSQPMFSPQA